VIEWTLGVVCYIAYLRMRTELPKPDDAEGAEAE